MAPKPPGIDVDKLCKELDSVFKMMEKHFDYVDDVVEKIDVAVGNVKLPKHVFKDIAHKHAEDTKMFEYGRKSTKFDVKPPDFEREIQKSRKFHYKVLTTFVGLLLGIIAALFFFMIASTVIDDSKKETPTKQPTQLEKVVNPKTTPNKTGPVFKEIK